MLLNVIQHLLFEREYPACKLYRESAMVPDIFDIFFEQPLYMRQFAWRTYGYDRSGFRHFGCNREDCRTAKAVTNQQRRSLVFPTKIIDRAQQVRNIRGKIGIGKIAFAVA
ncbi:hypothetical protein D3C84_1037160 [compost metagenome]